MNKSQQGFSLIELLMVLVIVMVLAALAIPSLSKAKGASENGSAVALMRILTTTQMQFYAQNNRYARLDELNNAQNGVLGRIVGTTLQRGAFEFEMVPPAPTDAQLRSTFSIVATRVILTNDTPYTITVDQTGEIVAVYGP